jgi:hypothetical protein
LKGVEFTSHLFLHEAEQALAVGQNPPVHDVFQTAAALKRGLDNKVLPRRLLKQERLLLKETVAVPERQEDPGNDLLDP